MKVSATSKVKDGFRWRCTGCKGECGIKKSSFFQDSNVTFANWMPFLVVWCSHMHATVQQLGAAIVPRSSNKTAMSMLKSFREMADRMALEKEDDYFGGNGRAVAVVDTGERCNADHVITLYIAQNGHQHMAHARGTPVVPIKSNS